MNYIWSRGNVSEFYNRSFTYNFGVKYSNKAKYYILHDLDILVKPNYIEEIVRRGYQKSRLFDYPTANIKNSLNLPCGVYQGDTNYNRPVTIYSNNSNELECHIHKFNKNIYDKKLTINNIKPIENTGYNKEHLCELAKVFIN